MAFQMSKQSDWVCDGEPKDGKSHGALGGQHQPITNFGDSCSYCGLPREAVDTSTKSKSNKPKPKSQNGTRKYQLPIPLIIGILAFLLSVGIAIAINPTIVCNIFGNCTASVQEQITFGERSLAPKKYVEPDRQAAIRAIAVGDYNLALEKLTKHLNKIPNDPEARIFLSNLQIKISKSKSYTIAVSVPISSDVDGSLEILRGVAQAQAEVNDAGGINKVPLRVAIAKDSSDEDANNDIKIAEQVAGTLSNNQDILGVVGHYASDTSLATANIYKNHNLVSISPISTSVRLSGYSPYFFRTVPNDKVAAQALAKYVSEKLPSKTTAVFYNSRSNYSKSLRQEFIDALGDTNIVLSNDIDCDLSTWTNIQSDWEFKANEVINKSISQNAKVLMLASNTSTLDKALQILVIANKRKLNVLGGDDVYAPKTLEQGEYAAGLVVAVAWDIDVRSRSSSDFPSRSKNFWGNDAEVNWRTVTAYDATQALIKAIEMQSNPTRKGMREFLASPSFSTPGASEKVRFDSNGDYLGNIELVEVQRDPKYPSGYDFKPVLK